MGPPGFSVRQERAEGEDEYNCAELRDAINQVLWTVGNISCSCEYESKCLCVQYVLTSARRTTAVELVPRCLEAVEQFVVISNAIVVVFLFKTLTELFKTVLDSSISSLGFR
jgi:hypothetical protein